MNPQLKEALKELGRLVVLTIVGYLLTLPTELVLSFLGLKLTPEQTLVVGGMYSYVLKAIDKYLHEKEDKGVSGGLTKF